MARRNRGDAVAGEELLHQALLDGLLLGDQALQGGDHMVSIQARDPDGFLLQDVQSRNPDRPDLLEVQALTVTARLECVNLTLTDSVDEDGIHVVRIHEIALESDLAHMLVDVAAVQLERRTADRPIDAPVILRSTSPARISVAGNVMCVAIVDVGHVR